MISQDKVPAPLSLFDSVAEPGSAKPQLNQAQRAALDLTQHCILTASAGSGKTTVLVNRIVEIIEKNGFRPEQVVAITFTEEAAAQMRNRVHEAIEARSREESVVAEENPWQSALDTLSLARITTLHGFCLTLLREFSAEAGLEAGFQVMSAAEQSFRVQDSIRRALRLRSERSDVGLKAMLNYTTPRDLQCLLVDLIQRRNHYQPRALSSSMEQLSEIYRRETSHLLYHSKVWADLRAVLERVPAHLMSVGDSYAQRCKAQKKLLLSRGDLAEDDFVLGFQETLRSRARPSRRWLDSSIYPELRSQWEAVNQEYKRSPLSLRLNRGDRLEGSFCHYDKALNILWDLYEEILESYQAEKVNDSLADFDDLLEFAHRLVRIPRVRESLRRRYPYLLVDEFQDTNHLQWRILLPLIGPDSNFFAVGDTKQSIYRFRDADVSVFREAQAWVERKGRLLELRENYRATPELVTFKNQIFRNLFRLHLDYEAVFQEMVACRSTPASTDRYSAVQSLFYDSLPDRLLSEADLTAEIVEQLVANGFRCGEIAVLLRSRTRLKDFEGALSRRQVPFSTLAGTSFYDEPEVLDLTNLLAFLDDPSFDLPLLGLLRSPFFNLSDEELFLISSLPGAGFWQKLCSNEPGAAEDSGMPSHWSFARDRLETWLTRYRYQPLAGFIEGAVEETGYGTIISASRRGTQALANLESFVDMVRSFERRHGPALRPLLRLLNDLRSVDSTEAGPAIEGDSLDAVRIYTIHGAKGLQFPAVVLPDLGSPLPTHHPSRFYCENLGGGQTFFGMRIRNPDDDYRTWGSPAYRTLRRMAIYRQLAEEKRLLYVATTRAQDRLLLIGRKGEPESYVSWLIDAGAESASESIPLLSSSSAALSPSLSSRPPEVLEPVSDSESAGQVVLEAPARREVGRPRLSSLEKCTWTPTEIVHFARCAHRYYLTYVLGYAEGKPMGWERVLDQHALVGSAVHEILESPGDVEEQLEDWERRHAPLFDGSEIDLPTEKIRKSLGRAASHPLLKRISHSRKHYSERRIHVRRQGRLITGVIDKLFQDEGGTWVIVDFKTGDVGSHDSREQVRRHGYDLQVELYLWATSRILATDQLEGFLLLTQSGQSIPIPFDDSVADRCEELIDDLPRSVDSAEFHRTTEQELCDSCGFLGRPCPGALTG